MIERQRRAELLKKSLAVVALIGSVVVIVAIAGAVWMQLVEGKPQDPAQDTPRTSRPAAAPASNIKPFPVRPVQDVRTPMHARRRKGRRYSFRRQPT